MAGGGKGLGGFLGGILENDTIKQIVVWQIIGQAISTVLAPYQQYLGDMVNSATPIQPLSPADLSDAVVRGFMDFQTAAAEASKAGVDADRFRTLVDLSGDAPSPTQLAEALRRGLIPESAASGEGVGFVEGIAQGNLADKWSDMIKQLSTALPTPADALDALLQGQTDYNTGKQLYQVFGGDPKYFDLMYNTRGSAPTPLQAIQMALRGYIPWEGTGAGVVSFEQAFLEGPWRNKWLKPYQQYAQYLPPVVQVKTLLAHGAITEAEAVQLYKQHGLSDQMAQAYLTEASSTKTTATKELAMGTVNKLYTDRLISRGQAQTMLESLKYTQTEADFILSVQDVAKAQHALSTATNRVHSLYVAHKLARTDALGALNKLGIPSAEIDELITVWDLEAAVNIKPLTEAQITDAFKDSLITQDEAMQALGQLGIQPFDAWVILSIKHKGALPGKPSPQEILPSGLNL